LILLDTNILIYCLKGREPVSTRVMASDRHDVCIPGVVAYEIEYGTRKEEKNVRRQVIVEGLLKNMRIIPFDGDAAREAARIRIDLERRGLMIGPVDLLISATALSRGATLVTNNSKEFSRIRGLRLADWTR
jgi:tRNA(fMet)-specific endonuclease VapC